MSDIFPRQIIGRLTIISEGEPKIQMKSGHICKRRTWNCLCECGNTVVVREDRLKSKSHPTLSCGCLQKDKARAYGKLHHPVATYGESRERIHNIWYLMKYRCENPSCDAYKNYGGRGISVCDEWKNGIEGYNHFKEWSLSHGYGKSMTIDRIDNDGNYCPENCRWITKFDQESNKRTNRIISWHGESKTLSQWARELGIPMQALHTRLSQRHWTVERAFTQPLRTSNQDTAIISNILDDKE